MNAPETITGWLGQQIEYAENEIGMLRSYRRQGTQEFGEALARRDAFKEVQDKLNELWGVNGQSGEKR